MTKLDMERIIWQKFEVRGRTGRSGDKFMLAIYFINCYVAFTTANPALGA